MPIRAESENPKRPRRPWGCLAAPLVLILVPSLLLPLAPLPSFETRFQAGRVQLFVYNLDMPMGPGPYSLGRRYLGSYRQGFQHTSDGPRHQWLLHLGHRVYWLIW
jgi:hypothetical protein